jgi:dihydroorotate dehydrogenase
LYETGTLESTILTEAVFTSFNSACTKSNTSHTKRNNPFHLYFKLAEGLYLLSHHLENNGAKEIINKEFKVENQVAGTRSMPLLLYQF